MWLREFDCPRSLRDYWTHSQAASLYISSQKIWQYTTTNSHITLAVKHSDKKLEKTIYKTDIRHAEWVGFLTNDNDDI